MRIIRFFVTAVAVVVSACSHETKSAVQQIVVLDETVLKIAETENQCRVIWSRKRSAGGRVDLALRPPCNFHRQSDGRLNSRGDSKRKVILIESMIGKKDQQGHCKVQVARVAISPSGVSASPNVANVSSCPPFQWDDVMYSGTF